MPPLNVMIAIRLPFGKWCNYITLENSSNSLNESTITTPACFNIVSHIMSVPAKKLVCDAAALAPSVVLLGFKNHHRFFGNNFFITSKKRQPFLISSKCADIITPAIKSSYIFVAIIILSVCHVITIATCGDPQIIF